MIITEQKCCVCKKKVMFETEYRTSVLEGLVCLECQKKRKGGYGRSKWR